MTYQPFVRAINDSSYVWACDSNRGHWVREPSDDGSRAYDVWTGDTTRAACCNCDSFYFQTGLVNGTCKHMRRVIERLCRWHQGLHGDEPADGCYVEEIIREKIRNPLARQFTQTMKVCPRCGGAVRLVLFEKETA